MSDAKNSHEFEWSTCMHGYYTVLASPIAAWGLLVAFSCSSDAAIRTFASSSLKTLKTHALSIIALGLVTAADYEVIVIPSTSSAVTIDKQLRQVFATLGLTGVLYSVMIR